MSTDFWTNLMKEADLSGEKHGSIDDFLSGKDIGGPSFDSVRDITDKVRAAKALSLPVEAGTRVSFKANLGAVMTYDDPPMPGSEGVVVTVKSANGMVTAHEGKVFVQWDDGKFRSVHAEHLRLAKKAKKKASSLTLRGIFEMHTHPDEYDVEQAGGPEEHEAMALRFFEQSIGFKLKEGYDGEVEVVGFRTPRDVQKVIKNLRRDGDRRTLALSDSEYELGNWTLIQPDGTEVPLTAWGKSARMKTQAAHQIRVASLGDLTDFFKVAEDTLIHRSSRDLWSFRQDGGDFVIERLFDGTGEPLKG